jgi:hypothetical protein
MAATEMAAAAAAVAVMAVEVAAVAAVVAMVAAPATAPVVRADPAAPTDNSGPKRGSGFKIAPTTVGTLAGLTGGSH